VRRGVPLAIAFTLTALLATASAPGENAFVRAHDWRVNGVPKPRVPARAAVDWCGLGQPTAVNRSPGTDLSSQRHVHVTYAIPADAPDRFPSLASPIATDAAAMDTWWRREDATRTLRFDLFAFPGCTTKAGRLDIGFIRLPRVGGLHLGDNGADRLLSDLGQLSTLSDFKHLVYYDGPPVFDENVCGTAFVPRNATTVGGSAGIAFVWLTSLCGFDVGASGLNAAVAVHELIHGLGALQSAVAPNECDPPDDGHVCDATTDVLFPSANSQTTISGQTLDIGRDDYYGHAQPWFDVQDSPWLSRLPQQRLAVTIQGALARTGVVRLVSPSTFECTQSCTLDLDQGVAATLSAVPRAGARFVRWQGACTGTGFCQVTLDTARSVTAVFAAATFRLTASVSGRGTVSSAPGGVACPARCSSSFKADSSVRLRPKPAAGFRFVSWTGACRGTGACVVKMSQNRSVKATFRRK
jgi:hypothetical protein